MNARNQIISEIINDLESYKGNNKYAIEENIIFFNSVKSRITFLKWLFFRAPNIDSSRLKELNDFPFSKWERELHIKLMEMERKKFPGMIEPLKQRLIEFILKEKPKVIVDLGSGAMEIDRQVLEELVRQNYKEKLIIIGIDKSSIAHELSKNNLADLQDYVEIIEADILTEETIDNYRSGEKNLTVILCKNNIFSLDKDFKNSLFDLIFYSKFRHHLNGDEKEKLDYIVKKIGKKCIEYDDYKSWLLMIPQSLATWNSLVLMNGAIFSRLRDLTKQELIDRTKDNQEIYFFKVGSYLLETKN